MNGEVPTSAAVTRSITNPETRGSLTIIKDRNVVADSLGHILAIPTHALMGRPQDIGKDPPKELIEQILERYKDVPWKGDVTVRIGHVDPKEDWKKTKDRLQKEGKLTVLSELGSKAGIYFGALQGSIFRADHYNPTSQTIHIFNPNLPIVMHELGHAEDLLDKTKRYKGFFKKLQREFVASKNAMKHMKSDQERRDAMKFLEPAFSTYIAGSLQKLFIGGRIALALLKQKTAQPVEGLERQRQDSLKGLVELLSLQVGPIIFAHINARLPGRKSSFGYIFSGEADTPPKPLKPHQILVATARPSG